MISDETVAEIRSAADIVEMIGEFVPLRRSGGNWRGPCPFHQGRNPNFSVSPAHGSYHCFVCHESGDVFTFVRKHLGLDWPSAVKYVGDKVGIEVVDTPRGAVPQDPNASGHEAIAAAAEWFGQQLHETGIGADARAYLARRGLDAGAWERFGLGFAPADGQALRRYMHSLGHDDDRLIEVGLLVAGEGDREARTRFRGRVMFPIRDESGRYVGFGGRAMGDEQPKYLNSPESVIFQKRRILYGLYTAKQAMRRNRRAIIVEGYLDAIRLTLAGLEDVVAPLGTALTEEQARLLVRYAPEVFLVYDSDEPGQKATFRSGLELLRMRAAVRIVTLPAGEDPDSFVRSGGREAMEGQLDHAIDLFDRQVQVLERRGWFVDLRHIRHAVDKLLPTIRAAADPLTRDLYLGRLAEVTGLGKTALAGEVDAGWNGVRRGSEGVLVRPSDEVVLPTGHAPSEAHRTTTGVPDDSGFPVGSTDLPVKGQRKRRSARVEPKWRVMTIPPRPRVDEPVERTLVRAMLVDRGVAEHVAERHPPATFRSTAYREIFSALLEAAHNDDLDQIAARLSEEACRVLSDLTEIIPIEIEEADILLGLSKLDARVLEGRIEDVVDTLRSTSERSQVEALMRERLELERELRRLLPIRSPRTKPRR